jgi:hypothetical protein
LCLKLCSALFSVNFPGDDVCVLPPCVGLLGALPNWQRRHPQAHTSVSNASSILCGSRLFHLSSRASNIRGHKHGRRALLLPGWVVMPISKRWLPKWPDARPGKSQMRRTWTAPLHQDRVGSRCVLYDGMHVRFEADMDIVASIVQGHERLLWSLRVRVWSMQATSLLHD